MRMKYFLMICLAAFSLVGCSSDDAIANEDKGYPDPGDKTLGMAMRGEWRWERVEKVIEVTDPAAKKEIEDDLEDDYAINEHNYANNYYIMDGKNHVYISYADVYYPYQHGDSDVWRVNNTVYENNTLTMRLFSIEGNNVIRFNDYTDTYAKRYPNGGVKKVTVKIYFKKINNVYQMPPNFYSNNYLKINEKSGIHRTFLVNSVSG